MHLFRLFALILFIVFTAFLTGSSQPPPSPASSEVQAELSTAFQLRLDSSPRLQSESAPTLTPELDTAFVSPDGKTAVLWVALRDESGRVLGTEPGLAIARRTGAAWEVVLPGDAAWEQLRGVIPQSMLPTEQGGVPQDFTATPETSLQAFTGYYLPYAAGTAHWLEGSIIHIYTVPQWGYPSCYPVDACRYAYDFTDYGHFPLLASKGGVVDQLRDSCPDNGLNCTNYMVLYTPEDAAYQIYLHLANGTIPDKLKVGSTIVRGQYLGDTDDTGYSTSNHVHFMVVQNPWTGSEGYKWGYSIDVRFADVPINNGIPRTCYEIVYFGVINGAANCTGSMSAPANLSLNLYTSGNNGAYPPAGSVVRPAPGVTVAPGTNPLMDATVTATDDVQVKAVKLMARINGQWVEIGPQVTQPAGPNFYDWDVNLCEVGPLNGQYEIAARVWDYEGNVTGPLDPRWITIDQACPGVVYLPLITR
jgi:hypothetical protein